MGYENQTGPKRNLGIEPNLEPIPYNPPDVLDDDAYPISQTWTDIKKKKKEESNATQKYLICSNPSTAL